MREMKTILKATILFCAVFVLVARAGTEDRKPREKRTSTWDLIRKQRIQNSNAAESPAKESSITGLQSKQRVVRFPINRSLGALHVQDESATRKIETFHHSIDGTEWEDIGEAQGNVTVPAGKRLSLTISPERWKDLSPLSKLMPDDLYSLEFRSPKEAAKPDDRCMPHIAYLTGLKYLGFGDTNISAKGLKHLANLKSLERLQVKGLPDDGLIEIAHLSWLKGLYLNEHRLTDTGITYLEQMKSLEELDLSGGRLGNSSLAYIAKLPSLRYLLLSGDRYTDAGMTYIKNSSSLRILHFGYLNQLTDAALVHLSQMPRLERLALHWNQNITDAGIVHLTRLKSLKMLDIKYSQVTDEGLSYLRNVKTLDYLILPSKGITDTGLTYLGELSNLKLLQVARVRYSDPNKDKGYYTDKGIAELAKCKLLEELTIGSSGLTDEGMTHIASLTNLRRLELLGCSNVTNNGLAKLITLKSLRNIAVRKENTTIGGLSFLNELPDLTNFNIKDVRQDDSGMDISGLTKLEDLTLFLHRQRRDGAMVYDSFHDEDWKCLANFTKLKRLQITGVGIGDEGIKHLSGLTNLEFLNIICPGEERITDAALKYMAGMQKLNRLYIKDGHFTDKALDYLVDLPALTWLELTSDYAFSNQAIRDFQRMNPNITRLQLIP